MHLEVDIRIQTSSQFVDTFGRNRKGRQKVTKSFYKAAFWKGLDLGPQGIK